MPPSVPRSTGAKRQRLYGMATDMFRLRIPAETRVRILELQEAGKTEEQTHADLHAGGYLNAAGKAWGATFSSEAGKIRRVRRAAPGVDDDDDDDSHCMDTPLIRASSRGDLAAVQTLLAEGADVVGRGYWGYTALIEASLCGHLAIVKALLAAGADVNASSHISYTALMCATENGHLDILKVLLAAGADVNATASNGLTALQIALYLGHAAVVRVLLAAPAITVAEEDRAGILETLHEADEALVAKAVGGA